MADENDDPDIAAARLEAALERIATRATAPPIDLVSGEIAERLDSLIDRLRDALATKPS